MRKRAEASNLQVLSRVSGRGNADQVVTKVVSSSMANGHSPGGASQQPKGAGEPAILAIKDDVGTEHNLNGEQQTSVVIAKVGIFGISELHSTFIFTCSMGVLNQRKVWICTSLSMKRPRSRYRKNAKPREQWPLSSLHLLFVGCPSL